MINELLLITFSSFSQYCSPDKSAMLNIETLHTFDTEYSADSVEWCLVDDDYFVVGTYQLDEKDKDVSANNVRKGRIYLMNFDNELNVMTKCQQVETDAILDQKWNGRTLITATSMGKVEKYELSDEKRLEKSTEVTLSSKHADNLTLSIDVNASSRVLASDSKGQITLINPDCAIETQWKAHEFEAWTCAFDRFNDNMIYSGEHY